MNIEKVYEEMFDYLKTQLSDEEINPYGATLLDTIPSVEPNVFPLIVMTQMDYVFATETLGKTNKRFTLPIEVNIFTIKSGANKKETIAKQLANVVKEVLFDHYGMSLDVFDRQPNLIENVYRIVMRFSCLVDEDTEIIYRE